MEYQNNIMKFFLHPNDPAAEQGWPGKLERLGGGLCHERLKFGISLAGFKARKIVPGNSPLVARPTTYD